MTFLRNLALGALACAACARVAASEQEVRPVVAHTGAYVRTVTAVITDAKGKPLANPPRIGDLEVLEDGVPARLLEIEHVAGTAEASTPPAPAPTAQAAAPGAAPAARRVHQTLYIDAPLLRWNSVTRVCGAVKKALPKLLAIGPLEIVVADPTPVVALRAGTDIREAEAALDRIGREVKGKDVVGDLRRTVLEAREAVSGRDSYKRAKGGAGTDMVSPIRDSAGADPSGGTADARVPSAVFLSQEVLLVSDRLRRVERWALSRPEISYGILYLASDGFDVDQSAFYANRNRELTRVGAPDRLPQLVQDLAAALLKRGWVAMPIGLGILSDPPSLVAAETSGATQLSDEGEGHIVLMERPAEPLRTLAAATGGELIEMPSALANASTALARAWVLTYQTATPRDGRTHVLTVRSRRRGILVHAAESVAAGTPESAAADRAARVLSGEEGPGDLKVTVALESADDEGAAKRKGVLATRADFAPLKELVARLGGGRLRMTVLVRMEQGEAVPHHEEIALGAALPERFLLRSPLVWPRSATRVAVVLEELGTGLWGAASSDLVVAPAAAAPVPASAQAGSAVPAAPAAPAEPEPASRDLAIVSFAAGLVTGKVPVHVALGGAREAELLLDGTPACALTAAAKDCAVELGERLAVHRLDLVRRDGSRATRWINRPGSSSAELRSRLTCENGDDQSAPCLLALSWVHPDGLAPVAWTVTLDGAVVSKRPEPRFALMVPRDREAHVASVEATFADGASASLVRLFGRNRAEETGDTLQAVPLEIRQGAREPGAQDASRALGMPVRAVDRGEPDVVVVLDPVAAARFYAHYTESLGDTFPGVSLHRLKSAAAKLGTVRFVHPESGGLRFPTLPAGADGEERVDVLFHGVPGAASGRFRFADAVAAAGFLAGASHTPRAVVAILGDDRRDESRFAPAEVRAYLAELMVPLVVLRAGEGAPGDWDAAPVRSQAELREALEGVRALLSRQRVAWVSGDVAPGLVALEVREEAFRIAGR